MNKLNPKTSYSKELNPNGAESKGNSIRMGLNPKGTESDWNLIRMELIRNGTESEGTESEWS